jgi:hemolysin III
VFFLPGFIDGATSRLGTGTAVAVLVLVGIGGLFYTTGGVVYGVKRPNPWPRWFGFHEVFHSFTILAFTTHYVGVSLATYSLR